jgi:protein TonB
MLINIKRIQNFDDIVFENRNKEYGAFKIRKIYYRTVLISLLFGILIMSGPLITTYFYSRTLQNREKHVERRVEITMQNLTQPKEMVALPPAPPAIPNVIHKMKYIPPVVVDSVYPEDTVHLQVNDDLPAEFNKSDVIEIKTDVKEEVEEKDVRKEPFLTVQEMPEPMGGEKALYKYIADNTRYPAIDMENNIGGKVFVRFCVTSKGSVEQVSILKGIDAELDAEAIRVVKSFPLFKPGKQDGKPVDVWFSVSINFQQF